MKNKPERSEQALKRRFLEFSDVVSRFSRGIYPTPATPTDIAQSASINLEVTKTVFSKWSLEILVLLYSLRKLGFEEIRKSLSPISRRILSQKLKALEEGGMVKRHVLSSRPPRVEYSLTEHGLVVTKLGEPVLLYLRSERGLDRHRLGPTNEDVTE